MFKSIVILLMVQKSGDHRLIEIFDPLLTQFLTSQVPGGADFLPSTVISVSHPMFFFIVIPLQGSRTTHTPQKKND